MRPGIPKTAASKYSIRERLAASGDRHPAGMTIVTLISSELS
jgi:hypothetical protein